MSPSGTVSSGYTTDLWPASATETDEGIEVISSTAEGTTAVTGIVNDAETGDPVSDAEVSMTCSSCDSVSTTTDAQGSFAFINMPPATYDLTVEATDYGNYSVVEDPYLADTPYVITVNLDNDDHTYEMANGTGEIDDNTNLAPSELPGSAGSQRMVPPTIRVQMLNTYPRGSPGSTFCTTSGGPTNPPVVTYSLDFYILHVVQAEVGPPDYNETAMKAFMSIVQNFAWFHSTKPGPYDVINASNLYAGQCFRPEEKIREAIWRTWLQDPLDERIADSNGNLRETGYGSGTPNVAQCNDPLESAHGGRASQWGLKYRSELSSCLTSDWRDLAVYYYSSGWSVRPGLRPPRPTASGLAAGGELTLSFSSTVYSRNVAWKFYLQRKEANTWETFKVIHWNSRDRAVPTSYSFDPGPSCVEYRVKAINPVNDSSAAIGVTPARRFTPLGYGLAPSYGQCGIS